MLKKACCLILAALVVLIMIPVPAVKADAIFAGGSGTSADPYQISTPDQLDAVRNHLSSSFILMADIDLSQSRVGNNWLPIGNDTKPFTGSLNGNGKTISNLAIDRADTTYVGLFGYASGASFQNMTLANVDVSGGTNAAGLIAHMANGSIDGIQVSGNIRSALVNGGWFNDGSTGGLVGYATNATVTNSSAAGGITSDHGSTGGLIGTLYTGTISQCNVTGNVLTKSFASAGLIGVTTYAKINQSNFQGVVSGCAFTGGLLGMTTATDVVDCSSDVNVTAVYGGTPSSGNPPEFTAGGFAGYMGSGRITGCHAKGSVNGLTPSGPAKLGGFLGFAVNMSASMDVVYIVEQSDTSCSVSGQGVIGGFVGKCNQGSNYVQLFRDCHATGRVENTQAVIDANQMTGVGGFVGLDDSGSYHFEQCYATGDVICAGGSYGFGSVSDRQGSTYINCGWNNPTSTTGTNKDISGVRRIGWARNAYIPLEQTQTLTADFQDLPTTLNALSSDHPDIVRANSDGTVTGLQAGSATVQIAVKCGDSDYTISQKLTVGSDFASGSGTPDDPYLIDSIDGLARMNDLLDASYRLTGNLDMSAVRSWTPIGSTAAPFTGSFDGGDYTITGLTLDKSTDNAGLFGMGMGATLSNVHLEDAYVTVGKNSGALIGYLYNGSIANCSATGQITTTTSTQVYSGMIVGYMQGGSLKDCYAVGDVTSYYAGVFAGYLSGTATNCYWYSSAAEKGAAQGGTDSLTKISVDVDPIYGAAAPGADGRVLQKSSTAPRTNFNLYGQPSAIEFLGSADPSVIAINNGQLVPVKAGKAAVTTRFRYANGKAVVLDYVLSVNSGSPPSGGTTNPGGTPTPTQTPSNYLCGITLSAGSLSRSFSAKATGYTVNLGENTGSVIITPVRAYIGATMTIDGKKVSAKTLSLANGKSTTVTVKVTWNKKTTTYKLTIKRAKSANNLLSSLGATAGTWSAPFNPAVTNYTLTLPENVAKVTLKGARASALATATPASKAYTLKNGQSVKATIKVKAQSGATRTYTVTITRAKSTNANLAFLKVSGATLSPKFSAGVTAYAVTLPAKTASLSISAKAADPLSKFTINGARKTALTVKLANGQSTTVTVTVISQAGVAKSYAVVVSRQ